MSLVAACGGTTPTCDECLAEQGGALTEDGCRPYCEAPPAPALDPRMTGTWDGVFQFWAEGDVHAQTSAAVTAEATGTTALVRPICPGHVEPTTYTGETIQATWTGRIVCSVPAYGCDVGTIALTSSTFTVFGDGVANVDSWGVWEGCGRFISGRLFFSGPRTSG